MSTEHDESQREPTVYLEPACRDTRYWRHVNAECLTCGADGACLCRWCDSCSQYWEGPSPKCGNDGECAKQTCPECANDA